MDVICRVNGKIRSVFIRNEPAESVTVPSAVPLIPTMANGIPCPTGLITLPVIWALVNKGRTIKKN
jgi:hypothetical protein